MGKMTEIKGEFFDLFFARNDGRITWCFKICEEVKIFVCSFNNVKFTK